MHLPRQHHRSPITVNKNKRLVTPDTFTRQMKDNGYSKGDTVKWSDLYLAQADMELKKDNLSSSVRHVVLNLIDMRQRGMPITSISIEDDMAKEGEACDATEVKETSEKPSEISSISSDSSSSPSSLEAPLTESQTPTTPPASIE